MRYFCFFSFFFLFSFLCAQENKDSYSTLEKQALLEKTENVYLVVEKALESFTQGSGLLSSAQDVLVNIEKQILLLQKPVKIEPTATTTRAERYAQERDYYLSLVKHWEEKKKILLEKQTHLNQWKKRLEEAENLAKSLDASFSQFQLVVSEVESRVVKNEINKEESSKYIRNYSVKQLLLEREKISKQIKDWQTQLKNLPGTLQNLQSEIKSLEDSLADTNKQLEVSIRRFKEVEAQEAIFKEFKEKDPGVLIGLLPSMTIEREKLQKAFEQNINDLAADSKYRNDFRESEKKLKMVPPDPATMDFQLASRIPSAQNAEKALKISVAMKEYQKSRLAILEEHKGSMDAFIIKINQAIASAQKYREHLVRNLVLVDLLFRLKKEGKIENLPQGHNIFDLEDKIYDADSEITGFSGEIKALKEKSTEILKAIEGTKEELKKIEESLPKLTKIYNEEKAWGQWIQEVETLKTAELITQFQKTKAEYTKSLSEMETAQAIHEDLRKKQRALVANIRTTENPLHTKSLAVLGKLHDEAKSRLQKIVENKQLNLLLDLTEEEIKKYNKELEDIAMSLIGMDSNKNRDTNFKIRFENQLKFVSSLISKLDQEKALREKFAEQGKSLLASSKEKISLIDKGLSTAKKLYGAALELQLRMGRKEIEEKDLPSDVAESGKREGIISLMERMETAKKEQTDIEGYIAKDAEISLEISQKQILLQNYSKAITQKLFTLQEIENQIQDFEQDFTKLDDTEKKRFEQKVQQRIYSERSFLERCLSYFRSPEVDETNALLEGDYRDLMKLEYKIQRLDKRIFSTEKIIKFTKEELKTLNSLFTFVSKEAKEIDIKSISNLARIEAKIKPFSYRETLLARLKEKTGSAIPLPEPLEKEDLTTYLTQAANDVFQIWIQMLSIRALHKALEFQCSNLGLASEMGIYALQIGEIESKKRQLEPHIRKLQGHPPEALASLDDIEKPKTPEDRYQFLHGTIEATKKAHLRALIWAASISLFSLVIIPLFALFLIRIADKIGVKIIERVNREGQGAKQEKEQRAQTLVGVFKAAWMSVVIVVAFIYILKQLQIDITPIIASAGVVGLAVAFGAQTLIKDFFYGFFILLENQYAVGDLVTIGNTTGTLEKITLRLTIIRSLDGTVHFIPNGSINMVSNFCKKFARAMIQVGVDYDSDLEKVLQVLNDVGRSLKDDPNIKAKVLNDFQVMGVDDFADSSINIKMWIKTLPGEQFAVARYTRKKIKEAFDQNGITIPFHQRVVHQA